jgi:hypothetical protein
MEGAHACCEAWKGNLQNGIDQRQDGPRYKAGGENVRGVLPESADRHKHENDGQRSSRDIPQHCQVIK